MYRRKPNSVVHLMVAMVVAFLVVCIRAPLLETQDADTLLALRQALHCVHKSHNILLLAAQRLGLLPCKYIFSYAAAMSDI
jgi:hypothetical protein